MGQGGLSDLWERWLSKEARRALSVHSGLPGGSVHGSMPERRCGTIGIVSDRLMMVLHNAPTNTDKPQSLITENMSPRGCLLDCNRGRQRAVCGSNGRLYKSLCAFQRAQCINSQLKTAPRAYCMDSVRSKCQLARSQAMESSVHTDTIAVFIPECNADGSFMQVQCHNQTGYCWCSSPDGKPVSGTSVLHLTPNCTGHLPESVQGDDSKSMHGEGSHWQATPYPESLHIPPVAGITAPPFWVMIQMNSDPKGNRSAKRLTGMPLTCQLSSVILQLYIIRGKRHRIN
ncbi:hypothetical protein ACEWY4_007702 [Coilia grayii]|uniref:Thyroglobulin type-1 domain-containing protein n=1 Tax=Coilia grayii TaxID=363190 RepID=A0ABD1K8Y5_9TELE